MKTTERNQAREFRKQGKSVREITAVIGVSKSSVSRWVRDIELTEEQLLNLERRGAIKRGRGQLNGAKLNRTRALELRRTYQEDGKRDARNGSRLHLTGCMLYWAEGAKHRNSVKFGTSDLAMNRLFLRFLTECFNVNKVDVKLYIKCYTDIYSQKEIETYWLNGLEMNRSCLRKTSINNRPVSSVHNGRGRKLNYGVCRIVYSDTRTVQRIFGSIQEYGNFINNKWIE